MARLIKRGNMSLSPELQRVRDSIDNVNLKEETKMTTATETTTEKKSVAKKAAPKPAAKKPAKKVAAKKPAAAAEKPDNLITLAELAKKAKIEPRVARRKLRDAGIERPDGSQWAWSKAKSESIFKMLTQD